MNREEIPMFTFNTKTKEFSVLDHKFEGVNSIEDFINYIHNLDKENKQLKSVLSEVREYILEKCPHSAVFRNEHIDKIYEIIKKSRWLDE